MVSNVIIKNKSNFISNIIETCLNYDSIRDDGKSLTFLDRIWGLFTKKHKYDHFKLACRRLKSSLEDSSIDNLNTAEKIVVYNRFKNIANKLQNKAVKEECNSILDEFQRIDPSLADIESISGEIFEELENNKKSNNVWKNTEKLCSLINYYKNDVNVLCSITKKWHSFFVKNEKSIKDRESNLYKSNEKICKLLLKLTEENLISREAEDLESSFLYYPCLLRVVLGTCNIQNELPSLLSNLKTVLNEHSAQNNFVYQCLHSIDDVLVLLFFSKRTNLSEFDKRKLIVYGDFFQIFEQHLHCVKDEKLILDIKLHCANLPCPKERAKFPHLLLSKKEQLKVLLVKLQQKEDKKINELIELLEKSNVNKQDIHHLTKLVSSKSNVSNENRLLLRNALAKLLKMDMDVDSIPWDDYQEMKKKFEEMFLRDSNKNKKNDYPHLISLKRISKTKSFFQSQVELDENMILIPQWYHATSSIYPILTSGEIQVRHKQAFKGAWLSSQREARFGSYALSLSDNITTLDSDVFIGFQYANRRWRGIQKSISLQNAPNLVLIGVPTNRDKDVQRLDKLKLVQILQAKGYPSLRLFSVDQVDFIQREVSSILGTPNLPDTWWGRGRAYSRYQEQLRSDMWSMEVDLTLFQPEHLDSQSAIAKIVQSMALPFYKKSMPRNPSYQISSMSVRIELGRQDEGTYGKKLDRIQKGESPAREHHGTMHCTRVALWTQVLSRAYEKLGREKLKDPVLLATAGAMHDVAREDEGTDYWDEESSMVLSILLTRANVEEPKARQYIQTIRAKDPRNDQFSTDEQRIVHDADCLDIIRVIGRSAFSESNLCFYKFDPTKKEFCNKLLDEVSDFIALTEGLELRTYLEHHSDDFYGDLVRMLFAMEKKGQPRFPLIRELVQEDMQGILSTQTKSSEHALTLF